jgi:3-hydroxyisobutyrate dehydrogenase-like beta-hydroxyacid dehydrogenase
MNVKKIHWLGVGLSSPPGILYLSNKGYKLEVWNRTPEKASRLL